MVVAQQHLPLVELVVHQVTACPDLQALNIEAEILVMNPVAVVAVVSVAVAAAITVAAVVVQVVGIPAQLLMDTPVVEVVLILAV
jgi:hypothetical protein